MGFLDEAFITARSGDGGRGCVSFRREKYIPKGGPDGGDGGDGGNVIARAVGRLHTLTEYSAQKYLKARNGEPGRGKNQSGKSGADLILEVPLGTIIEDRDTGEVLADLVDEGQEVFLIPGGSGGRGNQHFATSTRRVPRIAEPGTPGQEKRLTLSLKILADIGLIGLPNVGKSTLLSRLTMARPRIDNYPFTTLVPNLGVMALDDHTSVVIADIPGLIEGASQGRGLGIRFLRHIERTKLLLHILDITYPVHEDLLEDFHLLRKELARYSPELLGKPLLVLINKMDLYGPEMRDVERLWKRLKELGFDPLPISAKTGAGLVDLEKRIADLCGTCNRHDPSNMERTPRAGECSEPV
jgi:GTP-binding protein